MTEQPSHKMIQCRTNSTHLFIVTLCISCDQVTNHQTKCNIYVHYHDHHILLVAYFVGVQSVYLEFLLNAGK